MMRIAEALAAFRPHRGDAIVVPGRGGKFWVELTDEAKLDVPLGDPAMGGHAGFALGLALAQPNRKVVLFDSCLLYTSDAADDLLCVDLGGRRIIKKKNK